MLPAVPARLGQWRPPRTADLVNVGRAEGRLGQCRPRAQPTWSMVAVGSGRLSRFFLRGGLTWSMLLAGPPDLVNVERLGQCIGGGLGKHHLRRYYRNRTPPRRGEDWFLWVRLGVWESERALANHGREVAGNHNELRSFSAQDLGVCVFSSLIFS